MNREELKRRAMERPVVRVAMPLVLALFAGWVVALAVVPGPGRDARATIAAEMSEEMIHEGMDAEEIRQTVAFIAGWANQRADAERRASERRRAMVGLGVALIVAPVFLTIGLYPEIGRRRERAYPAA